MKITNVGIGKVKTKSWKVSASQIKVWNECPRKWGYSYIDDIKSPAGAGAILGSAVHKELEHHFKGTRLINIDTKPGRIAKFALEHLPSVDAIEKHGLVEPHIYFEVEGVLYRGYVDLTWKPDGDSPVISDHKTSSNVAKYGLKEDGLLTDPQGLIYGAWGLEHYDTDFIKLQWTYLSTRGKTKCTPVRRGFDRDTAHGNFMRYIQPVGEAIVEAVKTIDEAKTLPAKTSACGNFGGCPHAAYCPRTSAETLAAVFGEETNTVGLKDLIRSKKARNPDNTTGVFDADGKRPKNNVVEMPGQRINSPEAPKSPEIARTISQSGDPKSAAAAAAGADTPEEAQERIDSARPTITVGEPEGWDPSTTPSQDQVLAWVCSDTFTDFVSNKKDATKGIPFAHGRSLGSMGRSGLIEHKKEDGLYVVSATDKGIAKFRGMADADIWVDEPKPETPDVGAVEGQSVAERDRAIMGDGPVDDRPAPTAGSITDRKQLVAIYQRVDGKVIIEIDPEAFAR